MPELQIPGSISFKDSLGLEKLNANLNLWVVLYIAMALFWCYMAYTELSQKEEGPLPPAEIPAVEGSLQEGNQ